MIKAIETKYKGYRFRSRLEARWAVLFDALGILWRYEEQGFHVSSGMYLVDFTLPTPCGNIFVEIKGSDPTETEVNKISDLCSGLLTEGFLVWGVPGDEKSLYFRRDEQISGGDPAISFRETILSDLYCKNVPFGFWSADQILPVTKEFWTRAVISSRSARFEHGETPL